MKNLKPVFERFSNLYPERKERISILMTAEDSVRLDFFNALVGEYNKPKKNFLFSFLNSVDGKRAKSWLIIFVVILVSFLNQSCTSLLKNMVNRKYPAKFEASIKTESVKNNLCALKSFDRIDFALKLSLREIDQALQGNMVKARQKVRELKPFSVGNITMDSVYLDKMTIYSEEQFVGVKTVARIFFAPGKAVRYIDIEFDGSVTPSSVDENISLQPFLTGNGVKILKVNSRFGVFNLPFIKNFANKVIEVLVDNINGQIPSVNFEIKMPLLYDKKFSSFFKDNKQLTVLQDAELKLKYTLLPPAMLVDRNHLTIMTQIIDSTDLKVAPKNCILKSLTGITSIDSAINKETFMLKEINTKPIISKILATQFPPFHFHQHYKPRNQKNTELDSIQEFLRLYSYYTFIYDTLRSKYLSPDLKTDSTISVGNVSKYIIQKIIVDVFEQSKLFKVQYSLIGGKKQIDEVELKVIDNPKVDCNIFEYECNAAFNCSKVISSCNQDCRWTKPWNCAAKLACNAANGIKWAACEVVNVPIRGFCLAKAVVRGAWCLAEIVAKFALYHVLKFGTMNGDVKFDATAKLGMSNVYLSPDLDSTNLAVAYNAEGVFDAHLEFKRTDILGWITCPFPWGVPPINFKGNVTSESPYFKVAGKMKTTVDHDTTALEITTRESNITMQFHGPDGNSPLINLINANKLFFFECPLSLAEIAIGSLVVNLFSDHETFSKVNALYSGFYNQKLPDMKFKFKIKPVSIRTDFKEYTEVSQWKKQSVQFVLK